MKDIFIHKRVFNQIQISTLPCTKNSFRTILFRLQYSKYFHKTPIKTIKHKSQSCKRNICNCNEILEFIVKCHITQVKRFAQLFVPVILIDQYNFNILHLICDLNVLKDGLLKSRHDLFIEDLEFDSIFDISRYRFNKKYSNNCMFSFNFNDDKNIQLNSLGHPVMIPKIQVKPDCEEYCHNPQKNNLMEIIRKKQNIDHFDSNNNLNSNSQKSVTINPNISYNIYNQSNSNNKHDNSKQYQLHNNNNSYYLNKTNYPKYTNNSSFIRPQSSRISQPFDSIRSSRTASENQRLSNNVKRNNFHWNFGPNNRLSNRPSNSFVSPHRYTPFPIKRPSMATIQSRPAYLSTGYPQTSSEVVIDDEYQDLDNVDIITVRDNDGYSKSYIECNPNTTSQYNAPPIGSLRKNSQFTNDSQLYAPSNYEFGNDSIRNSQLYAPSNYEFGNDSIRNSQLYAPSNYEFNNDSIRNTRLRSSFNRPSIGSLSKGVSFNPNVNNVPYCEPNALTEAVLNQEANSMETLMSVLNNKVDRDETNNCLRLSMRAEHIIKRPDCQSPYNDNDACLTVSSHIQAQWESLNSCAENLSDLPTQSMYDYSPTIKHSINSQILNKPNSLKTSNREIQTDKKFYFRENDCERILISPNNLECHDNNRKMSNYLSMSLPNNNYDRNSESPFYFYEDPDKRVICAPNPLSFSHKFTQTGLPSTYSDVNSVGNWFSYQTNPYSMRMASTINPSINYPASMNRPATSFVSQQPNQTSKRFSSMNVPPPQENSVYYCENQNNFNSSSMDEEQCMIDEYYFAESREDSPVIVYDKLDSPHNNSNNNEPYITSEIIN